MERQRESSDDNSADDTVACSNERPKAESETEGELISADDKMG